MPVRSGHRPAAQHLAVGVVAAVLFALLVTGFYLASVHAAPGNSDGATVILEGRAVAGGNVLLNHWGLSLDSFWLVDVLLYAVVGGVAGIHPQLLHLVPAIAAAATVVLGAFCAMTGRRGVAAAAGGAVVVVMLGLPSHALAQFFLMGPLHVATTLWCMGAFVALRRARFGWGFVAAMVLLAAGLLGDFQTIILGVAPVVGAGIILGLRTRSRARALPAVAAGIGSLLLAALVRLVAWAIGSFGIAVNPRPGLQQTLTNLRHLPRYGASLEGFGVYPFGGSPAPRILEVAHGVGLAVALFALGAGVVSIVRGAVTGRLDSLVSPAHAGAPAPAGEAGGPGAPLQPAESGADQISQQWLSDVLVLAVFAGAAVFGLLPLTSSEEYGRYLTSAVIFLAIVAGRFVAASAARVRSSGAASTAGGAHGARRAIAAVLLVAALVVTAGYADTFARTLTAAPPPQRAAALTRYLAAHGLDHGIGDYWSSSIVTVESSGRVVVRPVIAIEGTLSRYLRQTSSTWYDRTFRFLVFNKKAPWGGVNELSAIHSFGFPAHIDKVGPYRIYVWRHPVRVPDD